MNYVAMHRIQELTVEACALPNSQAYTLELTAHAGGTCETEVQLYTNDPVLGRLWIAWAAAYKAAEERDCAQEP